MLFGIKLANDVYSPWKDSYIDYERLKKLLKESVIHDGRGAVDNWSERNESDFVEALDKELEKVYTFQISKYNAVLRKLDGLEKDTKSVETIKRLNSEQFKNTLEECLDEAQRLDNFDRLNFTGFIKIVKKHDKLHPNYPSVKSLLQVRLKELPFNNSEEYSPLLYRISYLYEFLRSNYDHPNTMSKSLASTSKLSHFSNLEDASFKSYKFWVHDDNIMEVKARILRHLPALLYASVPNENDDFVDNLESDVRMQPEARLNMATKTNSLLSDTNSNEDVEIGKPKSSIFPQSYDPTITTLYFDNEFFDLYNNRLLKISAAPTLRLRWIGKLLDKPDILLEKRTFTENTENGNSSFEEIRLQMKAKFINNFIFKNDPNYKTYLINQLRERGTQKEDLEKLSRDFDNIQSFIVEEKLQPVLRATYNRTAFQIPGDQGIRVTIDSNIMYIREDSLDKDRPIRNPTNWHRDDIDSNIPNPLRFLRPGEYSKFPYSVMEIKVINNDNSHMPNHEWIKDLTNSHLVNEVPKFSLYLQGVASLFGEDDKYINILPFWLPDLETDIRKNPQQAYEEEKKTLQRQKNIHDKLDNMRRLSKISQPDRAPIERRQQEQRDPSIHHIVVDLEDHESSDEEGTASKKSEAKKGKKFKTNAAFLKILAGKNISENGTDPYSDDTDAASSIQLPPGVKKPVHLLKNAGPVRVEAKVWLANERTFNRWLSVTTLLSVLTFSIYNSVQKAEFPHLADLLAYVYFFLTLFCGLWAYRTYLKRLTLIKGRSGKHLDAPMGPILVALVLIVTLVLNFSVAFKEAARKERELINVSSQSSLPSTLKPIQDFIFHLVGEK
ncbi:vacuolar transporter chaperone SKDI_16G2480 [Saccharomyces kudriavzevii IFO 1802]|uniref:SPX domain-containing protein n=1 Tax=Saccharomyces kudriavzevii (strain ATCC MYA-4449 / AS 2.2408 / CBS 8840 / NBRC 1802 / NCYC 2889) TaxID=226230 RepID=A0AA35NNM6_SACK1|nr:uncharacterized protein SKDI_16G2480 [Saccharomyces kudriavzevii IFO 1802]CAI4053566.1 hypothetical protein SKDI_16G2480 [Saccharomyces kudriavzevii IFO 1802]